MKFYLFLAFVVVLVLTILFGPLYADYRANASVQPGQAWIDDSSNPFKDITETNYVVAVKGRYVQYDLVTTRFGSPSTIRSSCLISTFRNGLKLAPKVESPITCSCACQHEKPPPAYSKFIWHDVTNVVVTNAVRTNNYTLEIR